MTTSTDVVDVLLIGGGPAGLTAATTLARQLHTVRLFDSKSYRNAGAFYMHMVPTWDHKDPKDFRAAAKKDLLARYNTITIEEVEVKSAKKIADSLFELQDGAGTVWKGRKLILATGSADCYPEIDGYEECWGSGIFHCLYCHGYEEKGSPSSGVLAVQGCANAPFALHMAENAAQLTSTVTIYTNGAEQVAADIQASKGPNPAFHVDARPIARFIKESKAADVTLEFEDGSRKTEAFLVHNPLTHVKGPFAEQLNLEVTPTGDVVANAPFHQTSVRGVFAAGDSITPYKVVPGAISSGCNAAVAAATQLQAEIYQHHPLF